jgi:superfamily II DNA or RNA helicase
MMPVLTLETPVKLRLPREWSEGQVYRQIVNLLGYENLSATHQWKTWKKALANPRHWFVLKYGREALQAKVAELDKERFKSILFKDDKGLWTYSGMAPELLNRYGGKLQYNFVKPRYGLIPWAKMPEHELRPFQQAALDLLAPEEVDIMECRVGHGLMGHGAVEIGTGLGKSLIAVHLLKRIGLPGIIVAPTLSIAEQLLKDLTDAFGTGRVGQYFGGKKHNKFFTVAVSKSLMNLGPNDKDVELLKEKKVLIGDESHLLPAACLQKVVLDLLGSVPYRAFLSATQLRSDGLQLLLRGITGPIQLKMSVAEGIDQGFLSPLKFFQYRITSNSNFSCDDVIKTNRVHLHQNDNVYRHAAGLINKAVLEKNRRVLVLVDTVDQYGRLINGGMTADSRFAHGPLSSDNRDTVPESQWKLKPVDLVREFDLGKFPVLVGTGAISIGTDIRSADFLINLVGLSSEVETRQGIGRGTRLFLGKKDTIVIDYDVKNNSVTHRHAQRRREIYNEIYGECKVLDARTE